MGRRHMCGRRGTPASGGGAGAPNAGVGPADPADRISFEPRDPAQCDLYCPEVRIPVGAGTPRVFPVLVRMSSHSRFCRTRMIPSRMTGDLLAGIWMWELIRSLCVVQRLCHRADRCRHRREDRGAGRSRCRAGATGLQDGPRARTTAERWRQVHELLDRGVGLLDCRWRLNLGLNTVKRYTWASEPERLHRVPQYRPTLVAPYRDYLRRRRTEEPGAPVPQLMDEIRELGYPGSANLLHRYLSQGEPMRTGLICRLAARPGLPVSPCAATVYSSAHVHPTTTESATEPSFLCRGSVGYPVCRIQLAGWLPKANVRLVARVRFPRDLDAGRTITDPDTSRPPGPGERLPGRGTCRRHGPAQQPDGLRTGLRGRCR